MRCSGIVRAFRGNENRCPSTDVQYLGEDARGVFLAPLCIDCAIRWCFRTRPLDPADLEALEVMLG